MDGAPCGLLCLTSAARGDRDGIIPVGRFGLWGLSEALVGHFRKAKSF